MAEKPTPIEMQKYLAGVEYPASKSDLLEAARSNGAPEDLPGALESVAQDEFDGPTAVSSAIS
jgi:hypothetical protein